MEPVQFIRRNRSRFKQQIPVLYLTRRSQKVVPKYRDEHHLRRKSNRSARYLNHLVAHKGSHCWH